MSKKERLKISHSVIEWLSQEITEVEHIIKKIKNDASLTEEEREIYDCDDLDYLENKLNELNQRSSFEAKNLKKISLE